MPTRAGFATAWIDPHNPAVWSGVLTGMAANLEQMGVFAGFRDLTPRFASVAQRWVRARGGTGPAALYAELRGIQAMSNFARRVGPRRSDSTFWIVVGATTGVPLRSPYASVSDMSPSQIAALGGPFTRGATSDQVRRKARLVLRTHKAAAICFVATQWAADGLIRDLGGEHDRVRVIGQAPNLEIDPPEHRDWSTPSFLFVGRDWQRKNGESVVEAFREVRRRWPDATLDLVGGHRHVDGPGVTAHGLLDQGRPADREKLVSLFHKATCLVMPSSVEPFGIVYTEAARAGVPSIGTKIGGMRTSIGDGGILVNPTKPAELIEAMLELSRPDCAADLGERALRHSSRFSWRKTAERIVRALELPVPPDVELASFL